MQKLRAHNWYSRVIAIAVALLISNVAALSCAMASALYSDCNEHAAAACFESCLSEPVAASDKSADNHATVKTPVPTGGILAVAEPDACAAAAKIALSNFVTHDPPPPLNLLHCVFLK
jgi:hypothetical protein